MRGWLARFVKWETVSIRNSKVYNDCRLLIHPTTNDTYFDNLLRKQDPENSILFVKMKQNKGSK